LEEITNRRASSKIEILATRVTRTPKKSKTTLVKREDSESEREEQREKFLERNRFAASKCRVKKKQWTNRLEEQARKLTQE
jgi:hypothetical protein